MNAPATTAEASAAIPFGIVPCAKPWHTPEFDVGAAIEAGKALITALPRVVDSAMIGSATYLPNPHDVDFAVLIDPELNAVDYCGDLVNQGWGNCGDYDGDAGIWAAVRRDNLNLMVSHDPVFFERYKVAMEVCKALRLEHKEDRIAVCQIVRDGKTAEQVRTHGFHLSALPIPPELAELMGGSAMNAVTKDAAAALAAATPGLELLRQPVPDHLISKKPQGTKAQNECPAEQKRNCNICGGWHHPAIKHLDYVGHAAATHRLLDADLWWDWEPMAVTEQGLPLFDSNGGLWIRLTVCGKTRIGYGNADKKNFGDAGAREKEVIGDAVRNAAMRFGLALELWSKADLHGASERDQWFFKCVDAIRGAKNVGELKTATQAAIAEAKARGDQEAEEEFLNEQVEKMAKAAPKKPPAQGNRPPPADDDDVPY